MLVCSFDAARLLRRLRNKRLVFVGDSLNRNQWVSMVCLIDTATPTLHKYMAAGNTSLVSFNIHVRFAGRGKLAITSSVHAACIAPDILSFRVQEYNASVDFYW